MEGCQCDVSHIRGCLGSAPPRVTWHRDTTVPLNYYIYNIIYFYCYLYIYYYIYNIIYSIIYYYIYYYIGVINLFVLLMLCEIARRIRS